MGWHGKLINTICPKAEEDFVTPEAYAGGSPHWTICQLAHQRSGIMDDLRKLTSKCGRNAPSGH
jgi:hypothetical protein